MQSSSVVVPFSTPKVPADLASIQSKVECYQKVTRDWLPYLNHMELAILMQVVDRTIGWGRREAYFTAVALHQGDQIYGGLSRMMSRATLFRALATLGERDIVRRRHDPNNGRKVYYSVNMGWEPPMTKSLNLPKRLKGVDLTGDSLTHETDVVSPMRLTKSHPCDTLTGNETGNLQTGNQGSPSVRPVPAAIEISRAKMASATAASRAAREAKITKLSDRVEGVEAAWRMALEEAHPQALHASWSVRDKAQIKAKLKTWITKDGPITEAVDWAVRNWAGIIAKQFRWMTRSPAPKVPEIGFFLSFLGQFLECKSEGKLDEWLAAPERTEFEKLTARGLSPDEAAAEIGERRAVEKMRGENEQIRIEARARVRRAEIIEKRAENVAKMPIHPDSLVARRVREQAATAPLPVQHTDEELTKIDWGSMPTLDPNWEPPQ